MQQAVSKKHSDSRLAKVELLEQRIGHDLMLLRQMFETRVFDLGKADSHLHVCRSALEEIENQLPSLEAE